MIPLRLELVNFLAYRKKTMINFEGIHLACLTGPNGAGKSSVLDAITWALWGASRARTLDELVHQGQTDMSVQLEFLHEGVEYRVLRKRQRGKAGTGTLTLSRRNSSGQFELESSGVVETERHIRALLKLDHTTFTNSSFLQQGRADLFMTKAPAERKKVLSSILGLDQWADYEARAKKQADKSKTDADFLDRLIQEIQNELEKRPSLVGQQEEAQQRYLEALERLEEARKRTDELRGIHKELEATQEMMAAIERSLKDRGRDLDLAQKRIESAQRKRDEYQQLIDQSDDIRAGYTAYTSAQEVDDSLRAKLDELNTIDGKRNEIEKQLKEMQGNLKGESMQLAKQISEARALMAQNPSEALAERQQELTALQEQQAQREAHHKTLSALKEQRGELEGLLKTLERDGKAQKERLSRLEQVTDPTCPLCGQPLDETHRKQSVDEIIAEIDTKRAEFATTRDAKKALEGEITTLETAIAALDADLKNLPRVNKQVGELQAQAEAASRAAQQLADYEQRQQEIDRMLNEESFGQELRQELAEALKQQDALGYDRSSHDDARQSIRTHQRYVQLMARLEMAEQQITDVMHTLENEERLRDDYQRQIDEFKQQAAALEVKVAHLKLLDQEFQEREAEQHRMTDAVNNARDGMKWLEQQISALDASAERKIQLEQDLRDAREREALYRRLAASCGKNGVPTMIIETAIPELEASANDMLARMTNGRMSVRLITQRDTRTGGISETLDIEISDELGTRSYDLFSGGEAFRVNFALRVALSKLLARRAGAHLRTLFIDEGFGTQDDDGRAKLVEAINVIQHDFDLILVITHIDELRESFPVHIIIEKGTDGSSVQMR